MVCYIQTARKKGINLNHALDETKISLHKVVACGSMKILKFYSENFSKEELAKLVKQPNLMNLTVVDLALKS